MEREQFTFYQSFEKAISRIKKKTDRCEAYDAIVRYALYGEMPDLERIADSAAIAFELSKPNLDASRRKAESGKLGGKAEAKPKQSASKTEANDKQAASKKEKEKEKEIEIENKCSIQKEREESSGPSESKTEAPVLPEEKVHLSRQEFETLMRCPSSDFSARIASFPEMARLQLIGERYQRGWFTDAE